MRPRFKAAQPPLQPSAAQTPPQASPHMFEEARVATALRVAAALRVAEEHQAVDTDVQLFADEYEYDADALREAMIQAASPASQPSSSTDTPAVAGSSSTWRGVLVNHEQ